MSWVQILFLWALCLTIFSNLAYLIENRKVFWKSGSAFTHLGFGVLMLGILSLLVIVFGFYPAPLLETFDISVNNLINNYEMAISSGGIE